MIEDLKRDREAGTPGPWGWEVSLNSHKVELCGGKGGTDLTVMSFVRWGMQHAAPMFWKWCGNLADEPKRADALAVPVPGREHHRDWFCRIDHPDARRIARVPEVEAALLAAEELAKAVYHERNMVCQDMNLQQRAADAVDIALDAYHAATGRKP